ncbi:uncharacterized protein G2W53_039361 [Senna tora]|uniref:Uncharacterized protein n=1 Tax=Senna tora TaxID=362788 RepID=A0A834W2S3_9FABA|nr:uncharacterized protein G2W53_039361 [Senna tora]
MMRNLMTETRGISVKELLKAYRSMQMLFEIVAAHAEKTHHPFSHETERLGGVAFSFSAVHGPSS